tara:strand:- start:211 stop:585 length:375 start_codon:yes stop_codon:yes gene_type:complete
MNDYTSAEFQRVLSNPKNEIISDSLIERLKPVSRPAIFSLSIGEDNFECSLDSFSVNENMTSISIFLNDEAVLNILSKKHFEIKCEAANLEISYSDIRSYNCFKYDGDSYILQLEVLPREILND